VEGCDEPERALLVSSDDRVAEASQNVLAATGGRATEYLFNYLTPLIELSQHGRR
jgi:hypothetical protein